MLNVISILLLIQVAIAIPLPALITRVHTAPAVTTTNTYTTGTTTVLLPPVEIFISNGVTYTFTLSGESSVSSPTTTTSIYNDNSEAGSSTNFQQASATPTSSTESGNFQSTEASSTQQFTSSAAASSNFQSADETSTEQLTSSVAPSSTEAGTQQPLISSDVASSSLTSSSESSSNFQSSITESSSTTSSPNEYSSTPASNSASETSTVSETFSVQSNLPTSLSKITSEFGDTEAPDAIVFTPYNDDSTCKSKSQIELDLLYIVYKGIKNIRVYGTDCDATSTILPLCETLKIKVNQGLYITNQGADSIDQSLNDIITYGQNNGFDVFRYITVGNEAVNDGYVSASDLSSKISEVKQKLNSAGYSGKVTTSEPPNSFIDNPDLCDSSVIDFVGINVHSYFDPSISAQDAGSFIENQKSQVQKACGSQNIVITETGYPSKGNTNGKNVPSASNQQDAINSIVNSTGGDITILSTFNEYWKDPGPYGIEQYFGAITLFG